jgi:hypothetical protein
VGFPGRRAEWMKTAKRTAKRPGGPTAFESHQSRVRGRTRTGSGQEEVTAGREHLALLLDRLREEVSPLGWRLFDLLFVQALSLPEVREASGLSADAVYAWRSRLRRLARKLLADLSENPGAARKTLKEGSR